MKQLLLTIVVLFSLAAVAQQTRKPCSVPACPEDLSQQSGAPLPPSFSAAPTNPKLVAAPSIPGQNHGINLAWTETGCSSCTFDVYRGTTTGGENYGTPLATVPSGTLTYLDQTGAAGTQYFYTVTALLGTIQSSPSGEANATYPTVPGSPSSLTAQPQ